MQPQLHPAWKDLLAWLADHGMDISGGRLHVEARLAPFGGYGMFALREIPPSTPLFTIPAAVLPNLITLSPHYPKAKPKLSSVQLISLHLLLHRPKAAGPSRDPLFGPYLSTLPASFDGHPLTWYWKRGRPQACASPGSDWLLDNLPPFVKRDLERVARTFEADWNRVRSFVQSRENVRSTATNPNIGNIFSDPDSLDDDYLWAWLNVNTRCIYYRLKEAKSDPDNLTLCPVLDVANHISVGASMIPQASSSDIWDMAPPKKTSAEDMVLLSPSEKTMLPGEELHLCYGHHSNQFLFVEYGFVNNVSGQAILNGDERSDVDISPVVEELFKEKDKLGEWLQDRLVEEGYWGEWTLHSAWTPAHPSYRLITALRLLHLLPSGVTSPKDTNDSESLLDIWRATVNGTREFISDENETRWRESLLEVCEGMMDVADTRIASLVSTSAGCKARGEAFVEDMMSCVVSLWSEEKFVAKAVINSLKKGVSF